MKCNEVIYLLAFKATSLGIVFQLISLLKGSLYAPSMLHPKNCSAMQALLC